MAVVDSAAIYRKSELGRREIAERIYGLSIKQRTVLILLDGKRGWADVVKAAQGQDFVRECMEVLLELGLIELSQASTERRQSQENQPPSEGLLLTADQLDARRDILRAIYNTLGPAATDICIQVESAKTLGELRQRAAKARDLIQRVKPSAAASFAQLVSARL